MILTHEFGEVTKWNKEKKPHFGRRGKATWDCVTIFVDAKECEVWFDSTWGSLFHLSFGGDWYNARIYDIFSVRDKRTGVEHLISYHSKFFTVTSADDTRPAKHNI